MDSLYGNFEFPAKQDIFENQRIVLPSKYETWRIAV